MSIILKVHGNFDPEDHDDCDEEMLEGWTIYFLIPQEADYDDYKVKISEYLLENYDTNDYTFEGSVTADDALVKHYEEFYKSSFQKL